MSKKLPSLIEMQQTKPSSVDITQVQKTNTLISASVTNTPDYTDLFNSLNNMFIPLETIKPGS